MNKIPSDEEFLKTKQHMRKLDLNINHVNKNVLQYFKEICPIGNHNFYLIAEGDKAFRAYVFYKTNTDLKTHKKNGTFKKIEDFVYAELERQGRGTHKDITIAFEFDSDENVTANYDGDYFLRLR